MTGPEGTPEVILKAMLPDEALKSALDATVVTPDVVYGYLARQSAAYHTAYGRAPDMPVELFGPSPEDLESYQQAMAWWPRIDGIPEPAQAPCIVTLCQFYWEPQQGRTFMERLMNRSTIAVEWLKENGYDPNFPNESKEERRRRLARERAVKHRNGYGNGHADQVKEAWNKVQELRQKARVACRDLEKEVSERYAHMMEASNELRIQKAKWTADINRALEEHQRLVAQK